jgi:hypothetical protein
MLESRNMPSFLPAAAYPDIGSPRVGDFNNDGIPDLVGGSASASGTSISVLLGNGNGTFQAARTSLTPGEQYVEAVGDFNNDGKLDLVTDDAPGGDSDLHVLPGNGDGTFQPARRITLPSGQASGPAVTGDFNNDGKLDLVVGGSTTICHNGSKARWAPNCSTTVYLNVLLGNGDGSFTAKSTLTLPHGGDPRAVGDFNRDGNLDVLIGRPDGVDLLPGKGDGTLAKPTTVARSVGFSLVVADFNGDGKLDFATSNFDGSNVGVGNSVSVFLGKGDATFQTAQTFATGPDPRYVSVGDFNGDGRPDLLTRNGAGDTVSVLLGNGDGTFQTAQTFATGSCSFGLLAVGDFNGDGFSDLAGSAYDCASNSYSLLVLLNDGHW